MLSGGRGEGGGGIGGRGEGGEGGRGRGRGGRGVGGGGGGGAGGGGGGGGGGEGERVFWCSPPTDSFTAGPWGSFMGSHGGTPPPPHDGNFAGWGSVGRGLRGGE